MTLSEGDVARQCTIDGPQSTVLAVDDFTWRLQTRGSGTNRGMVGEVEGYVRMRWQQLGAAGEGKGGRQRQRRQQGGSNAEMVCGMCSRVCTF